MKLNVNGEEYRTEKNSVRELSEEMGVEPGTVAVEVNMAGIKRREYEQVRLQPVVENGENYDKN